MSNRACKDVFYVYINKLCGIKRKIKLTNSEQTREHIKSEFQFLIDSNGFILESDFDDPIYSEVQYCKDGWTISIKTIAHGTKVSLMLVSPSEEIGFIAHLFPEKDQNTKSVLESIKYNSSCFKEYGKSILNGSPQEFDTVLSELKRRQLELIDRDNKK
jgi:hypothetical protein